MKKSPLVLLVHGYNVFNPETSVGKLRTFFEVRGCPTVIIDYGHTGLRETRRKNPKVAGELAAIVAASKLAEPAVYINPALEKHLAPGPNVARCHVWHSPSDSPVKWGRRLSKIIPRKWFNARPWGEMGAVGYAGEDPRVTNFNKEKGYVLSSKEHSDVFKWELMPYFGGLIVSAALL